VAGRHLESSDRSWRSEPRHVLIHALDHLARHDGGRRRVAIHFDLWQARTGAAVCGRALACVRERIDGGEDEGSGRVGLRVEGRREGRLAVGVAEVGRAQPRAVSGAQLEEWWHRQRGGRHVLGVVGELAAVWQPREQRGERRVDLLGHALARLALEQRDALPSKERVEGREVSARKDLRSMARFGLQGSIKGCDLFARVLELGHLGCERLVRVHQSQDR
jgi:hypothetical protein